ncbi:hypothetical protein AC1031_008111 [Aphanomyces cochlioides]|nr:hypothetical protein AC1031_008111 [Aphanomyces cochlioides]
MNFMNNVIGMQLSASIRSMLFEKSLRLNGKSKKVKTAGDIANLFSMDVLNIMQFTQNLNLMWIVPLQVAVVLVLIEHLVGWAIFIGLAVVLVILVITALVAVRLGNTQSELFQVKDARMQVINEVFGAIQIVKFNAWEEKFLDKLTELRVMEIKILWKFWRQYLVLVVFMFSTPVLVTITVFATYTLWMHDLLTVATVFSTLALFKSLQDALIQLPVVIMSTVKCLVSVKRINDVLLMDECDPSNVQTPQSNPTLKEKYAVDRTVVAIEHGAFGWDDTEPFFSDLNLTIQEGQLVVVHGAVGQGKSSLCSIFLGEMEKYAGSVFVGGSVAYSSQQPWIQNATIRDNILFGKPFDEAKYADVVRACALTKDLDSFPAGDRTEIGQKGVNLSGGQKARVSLARACYSDADIFVLDAPLAAVDAIVSSEIFTNCILGLLRHKTVILVTHNPDIINSPYVNRSFLIQDGKVTDVAQAHSAPSSPSSSVAPLRARPGHWSGSVDNSYASDLIMELPKQKKTVEEKEAGLAAAPPSDEVSGRLIDAEGRAEGRVSKAVVMKYLRAIGGWPAVSAMVLMSILVEGLRLASDMWLSHWSNEGNRLSDDEFRDTTNTSLTIYTILVAASCAATVLQMGSVVVCSVRGAKSLFANMLASVSAAPISFFDTNPIGRLLNRFGDDIIQVDLVIPTTFSPILTEVASVLSRLVTTIVITQWMGIIVLPLMFIYFRLGSYFLTPLREINRIVKVTRSPLLSLVSEGVDGSTTIRAFGQHYLRRFYTVHDVAIEEFCSANFVGYATNQWFALRVDLISSSVVFALLMGIVVMHNSVSAGLVGLVITYGLTIPASLNGLVNVWAQLETALIAPERLNEYISLPDEGKRHTDMDSSAWPTKGEVVFDAVSYRYKDTDPLVLKEVSFTVHGGEKIGIVGRTGAGKSSLMMSLFRMNDVAAGSIRIDGVDIATLGLKHLRSQLAIIPQNPVLFKGTLRSYLDPFDEFDDAALWSALTKVQLADRVCKDKLDGAVDENGDNFSVGERQMLCMARALLRQAKIVVLDEATAAIDHETDQLLQRVLRTEFASSTVLSIAHRLDTVLDADRIVVLDHGELVQYDKPAALVAKGSGIFYELVTEGGYMDKVPTA